MKNTRPWLRGVRARAVAWTAFSAALAALSSMALTQNPQPQAPAARHGDVDGLWVLRPAGGAWSEFAFTKEEPPMTAWSEEKYRAAKPAFGPRKTTPSDSNDPVYGCFPPGVPRIYLQRVPMEIIQSSNEVIMLFEYDRLTRHIFTDGRKHDPDLDPPPWMGDAIGHWEGDTLVVDTIGLNDKTWLDRVGHPHSDALHVVERLRRAGPDSLEDRVTIEDATAYQHPWSFVVAFERKSNAALDWEGVCEDKKLADRQ